MGNTIISVRPGHSRKGPIPIIRTEVSPRIDITDDDIATIRIFCEVTLEGRYTADIEVIEALLTKQMKRVLRRAAKRLGAASKIEHIAAASYVYPSTDKSPDPGISADGKTVVTGATIYDWSDVLRYLENAQKRSIYKAVQHMRDVQQIADGGIDPELIRRLNRYRRQQAKQERAKERETPTPSKFPNYMSDRLNK